MVIEGIYNTKDGKIYLVADSIRNRADALRVVLHETVGHLGLRKALGDKFNAILDTIYSNKEYAKAIDALATELKKTTRIATEEWFARKVQVGEVENSLWTKVIAKLRQVLRDLGFTIKFSDAELKSLIERSYTEARRGEEGAGTTEQEALFAIGPAYHGSPYEFDKFKTKKIGTGEGEAAFGWGLYFTDKKDIAKNYADALGPLRTQLNNKEIEQVCDSLEKAFKLRYPNYDINDKLLHTLPEYRTY